MRDLVKAEGGKEGKEEEDTLRWVEKEVMNAVMTANLVDPTTSDASAREPLQRVHHRWDCSQVENEPEDRCDGLAHG